MSEQRTDVHRGIRRQVQATAGSKHTPCETRNEEKRPTRGKTRPHTPVAVLHAESRSTAATKGVQQKDLLRRSAKVSTNFVAVSSPTGPPFHEVSVNSLGLYERPTPSTILVEEVFAKPFLCDGHAPGTSPETAQPRHVKVKACRR